MIQKFQINKLPGIAILGTCFLFMSFMLIPGDQKLRGVDDAAMDKSIKPSDDFFLFSNGAWVKNNPVPASEAEWSAFNELQEQNNLSLRKIIETASKSNAPVGSITQKVGDFYAVAMDTLKIEKQGLRPLLPYLQMIDSIQNSKDVIRMIAYMHSYGIGCLFGFYITQDQKKSEQYIAYISQGGLGLPDRDYYTKDDDDSKRIRSEYLVHIQKVFDLAGKGTSENTPSDEVIKMETALATASMTNVELRDDEKQYNKYSYDQLLSKFPNIFWNDYFQGVGISKVPELIVSQPDFFMQVDEMMKGVSIPQWKIYLKWCLINEAADKLTSALEMQNFRFYGTVLSGTKEMRPRWKRMISATNNALGEPVGQLYVEKNFSPESKKRVNEMVDNLMAAYKERIKSLDWMSEPTKQKALVKLASFERKLGYPDKWKDFSSLQITRESYLNNAFKAQFFRFKRMVNKLGKPIDRAEWGLSPQTVNAYYNPSMNEIVFPAAIMQPPFFNAAADDAVNYGAIGAVIGHEITHGFDDQGSKFDESGNLNDWWTAEDRSRFESRTKKLVEQFNGYQALEDLNVNGELTLGENIADLGGLTMAYLAYQKSLVGKTRLTIDGFTPEQRFFIGWAQVWRVNYRPESLRRQVLTNVHSPDNFRAIGAPSNLNEFYKAFDVKPKDKMYRDNAVRVQIW